MRYTKLCVFCKSRIDESKTDCPFCGMELKNTNPDGSLPLGTVLKRKYTVGRFMSIDGEGITYLALANDTAEDVVIKEFLPVSLCAARKPEGDVIPRAGKEVQFKTTLNDFVDMYKGLMRVTANPGLVHVIDVMSENRTAYAVTENVIGMTLREYLEQRREKIPFEKAEEMLEPIFSALDSIHEQKMLHRGVSPDTIIVKDNGKLILSGYATLALRTVKSVLKPQLFSGYTAPEQYVVTEFHDTATDVYALAAVMYRMITGIEPQDAKERFTADNLKVARGLAGNIPNLATSAIHRALRLSIAERTKTGLQFLEEFESPPPKEPEQIKHNKRAHVTPFVYLIAGMVVVASLVVWYAWSMLSETIAPAETTDTTSSSSSEVIQQNVVPSLVGRNYTDVQADTDINQKFLFDVQEQYHPDYPAGQIYAQQPLSGEPYVLGDSITIIVSLGPEEVIVPANILDLPVAEAVAILEDLGLAVETYDMVNPGDSVVGTVVQSDPAPGDTMIVGGGDSIRLYVALPLQGETEPGEVPSDSTVDTSQSTVDSIISSSIPTT